MSPKGNVPWYQRNTAIISLCIALAGQAASGIWFGSQLVASTRQNAADIKAEQQQRKDDMQSLRDDMKDRLNDINSKIDILLSRQTKQ